MLRGKDVSCLPFNGVENGSNDDSAEDKAPIAQSRGDHPLTSAASISAPRSSSLRTIDTSPSKTALCSTVRPSEFNAFKAQPAASKASTTALYFMS